MADDTFEVFGVFGAARLCEPSRVFVQHRSGLLHDLRFDIQHEMAEPSRELVGSTPERGRIGGIDVDLAGVRLSLSGAPHCATVTIDSMESVEPDDRHWTAPPL